MAINKSPADNPWFPWVIDPVLFDERLGRWHWYWVLPILAIGLLIYIFLAPMLVSLIELVSVRTNTAEQFSNYASEIHDIFLENNIYSFLFPALGGGFLILLSTALLSLHRHRLTVGLTYNIPISWQLFWKASLALCMLFLINIIYLFLFKSDQITINNPTSSFLFWFTLGLFALWIQALGEELMFRGYLLRIFGALIPIRMLAILLVLSIFIYHHAAYDNNSNEFLATIIFFMTSELVYFWILFRTRSLMATWGLRWVNNVFFMLIISVAVSKDDSFTLFKYSFSFAKVEGSYFEDPTTYLLQTTSIILFILLIVWNKSPFYLAPAPIKQKDQ